ncbi:hypothetical protein J6590_065625 [Homalodisca vitripennis]|nr:hypothetical protein J6590_065625 [Homalodisca vitripennis]
MNIIRIYGWKETAGEDTDDQVRSYNEVRNLYYETYPNRNAVSKSGVKKTFQIFLETGTVNNRPKSAANEALDVLQSVVEDRYASKGNEEEVLSGHEDRQSYLYLTTLYVYKTELQRINDLRDIILA